MSTRSSASLAAGIALAGVGAFVGLRRTRSAKSNFTMTVLAAPDECRERWIEDSSRAGDGAAFRSAPGDRGTEITVPQAGRKKRERLRAFKQVVETGALTVSQAHT